MKSSAGTPNRMQTISKIGQIVGLHDRQISKLFFDGSEPIGYNSAVSQSSWSSPKYFSSINSSTSKGSLSKKTLDFNIQSNNLNSSSSSKSPNARTAMQRFQSGVHQIQVSDSNPAENTYPTKRNNQPGQNQLLSSSQELSSLRSYGSLNFNASSPKNGYGQAIADSSNNNNINFSSRSPKNMQQFQSRVQSGQTSTYASGSNYKSSVISEQTKCLSEKQIIVSELKGKIMDLKAGLKEINSMKQVIRTRLENQIGHEMLAENNVLMLQYMFLLSLDEIDKLIQKKKNRVIAKSSAILGFLDLFDASIGLHDSRIAIQPKSKKTQHEQFEELKAAATELREYFMKENVEYERDTQSNQRQLERDLLESLNASIEERKLLKENNAEVEQKLNQANNKIIELQEEVSNKSHEIDSLIQSFEEMQAILEQQKQQNAELVDQVKGQMRMQMELTEEMSGMKKKNAEKDVFIAKKLGEELESSQIAFEEEIYQVQERLRNAEESLQLSFERESKMQELLSLKQDEVSFLAKELSTLKRGSFITNMMESVDKDDQLLLANLVCLVERFTSRSLTMSAEIAVLKYLEEMKLVNAQHVMQAAVATSVTMVTPKTPTLITSKCSNCIENVQTTLGFKSMLESYMQKLTDKIVKQQVLHEELEWFKDNIDRLLEKFMQMSKNQISFNHIDFFKQEIQIRQDRIKQKITALSPNIQVLTAELQDIAMDTASILNAEKDPLTM